MNPLAQIGLTALAASLVLAADWAWTKARARPGTLECLDCGHKQPFTTRTEAEFNETAKRLAVHHTLEHRTGLAQPRISPDQTPTMAIVWPVRYGPRPGKDTP